MRCSTPAPSAARVSNLPIADPAGLGGADPETMVSGVLDILRSRQRPRGIREVGQGLHGERRMHQGLRLRRQSALPADDGAACDAADCEGFAGAPQGGRHAVSQGWRGRQRAVAVATFRKRSDPARPTAGARRRRARDLPDVVFYTGCNVLKTPHIALLCLDIMDMIGTDYQVMGGPTHCCGTAQLRAGDIDTLGRFANNTIYKLSQSKTGQVLAWCPSCVMQFGETVLPTVERATGQMPFDMTPFMRFLHSQARCAAAVPEGPRRDDGGAAPASGRGRRDGGGGGTAARCAGHQDRQAGCARGRAAERQSRDAAEVQGRASVEGTGAPRRRPASTRWSRSITPITASCARTSATGRSGS